MVEKEKMHLDPDSFLQLNMCDRVRLTDNELTGLDFAVFHEQGITSMEGLFSGCEGLENPNLSRLDTSSARSMAKMFAGCKHLRSLDLSTFDFSQVTDMSDMFSGCESLQKVILSDTIRHKVMIPRIHVCPYTKEELDYIARSEYIACGPQLADMAVERAIKHGKHTTIKIPFFQATEEEVYGYLGLRLGEQTLTIVPHRTL